MGEWWRHNIIDAQKLPLLLCFVAFVVTFLVTRTITRLIRAGKGPFHDQVTSSGLHIHHAVPGLILLVVGAFVAVAAPSSGGYAIGAALAIGIGVSLVLDEFALILHLDDVYWTGEGRVSVDMVSLTAACLAMALLGLSPVGVTDVGDTEAAIRISAIVTLVLHGVFVVVNVLKRKYAMAAFGLFIPVIALLGALRLGRPGSWWCRTFYRSERKQHRAQQRAERSARRWAPWRRSYENLVGGRVTPPAPMPAPVVAVPDDVPVARGAD